MILDHTSHAERRKWNIRKALLIAGGLILVALLFAAVLLWSKRDDPRIRARRELITFKLLGVLPDESWKSVIRRMNPSSVRDSVSPLRVDASRAANPVAGAQLFRDHCASCHGSGGEGGRGHIGVNLTGDDIQLRLSDLDIYTALTQGVPGTNMPPSTVDVAEGLRITTYVRSLHSKTRSQKGEAAPGADCIQCRGIHVSSSDIIGSATKPEGWLSYSGDYSGRRFSTLAQITRTNLSRLRPRFVYQTKSLAGVEATPLVSNGVMFLTGPENEIIAINLANGEPLWTYRRVVPAGALACCGRINRGVAVLGNRLFHATADAHLMALDITTGKPVWDAEVADYRKGYSMTGAPLAIDGRIIVGIAGGDFGVRGFLDAYDPETGKRVWRFDTVPSPGQPGSETWKNDAWKTGGGATWMIGTYDPALHLLYWGVGNPAPEFNPHSRPGDNLYTCSVVALDPDTGTLRWHYQFSPNDGNDWDANEVPVLVDAERDGRFQKLMYFANRNCFFYTLDRTNGKFLGARPYCDQNWNDGFTPEGRPIRRPGSMPSDSGPLVRPSVAGGANWPPPAYSPLTGLFYVKYRASHSRVFAEKTDYVPGALFLGGRDGESASTVLHLAAIRGLTGKVVWDRIVDHSGHDFWDKSGVLATGTGLVFTGDSQGRLLALAAETGEELWSYTLGAQMAMAPMTYRYKDAQEVAVISGGALMAFSLVN